MFCKYFCFNFWLFSDLFTNVSNKIWAFLLPCELCENLVISGLWECKYLYNIVWNCSFVKVTRKKNGIFIFPFQFVLIDTDVRVKTNAFYISQCEFVNEMQKATASSSQDYKYIKKKKHDWKAKCYMTVQYIFVVGWNLRQYQVSLSKCVSLGASAWYQPEFYKQRLGSSTNRQRLDVAVLYLARFPLHLKLRAQPTYRTDALLAKTLAESWRIAKCLCSGGLKTYFTARCPCFSNRQRTGRFCEGSMLVALFLILLSKLSAAA